MKNAHVSEWYTAYLEGSLPEARRREVEAHLQACSRCAEELAAMRRLVDDLHALPAVPPPAHMAASVRAQLKARPQPRPLCWRWPVLAGGLAASALTALLLVVLLHPLPNRIAKVPEHPTPITRSQQTQDNQLRIAQLPKKGDVSVKALPGIPPAVGYEPTRTSDPSTMPPQYKALRDPFAGTAPQEDAHAVRRSMAEHRLANEQSALERNGSRGYAFDTRNDLTKSTNGFTYDNPTAPHTDGAYARPDHDTPTRIADASHPSVPTAAPPVVPTPAPPKPAASPAPMVGVNGGTRFSMPNTTAATSPSPPETPAANAPGALHTWNDSSHSALDAGKPEKTADKIRSYQAHAGTLGEKTAGDEAHVTDSLQATKDAFARECAVTRDLSFGMLTAKALSAPTGRGGLVQVAMSGTAPVDLDVNAAYPVLRTRAAERKFVISPGAREARIEVPTSTGGTALKLTFACGKEQQVLYLIGPGTHPRQASISLRVRKQPAYQPLLRLATAAGIYVLCPSDLAERQVSFTANNQPPLAAMRALLHQEHFRVDFNGTTIGNITAE